MTIGKQNIDLIFQKSAAAVALRDRIETEGGFDKRTPLTNALIAQFWQHIGILRAAVRPNRTLVVVTDGRPVRWGNAPNEFHDYLEGLDAETASKTEIWSVPDDSEDAVDVTTKFAQEWFDEISFADPTLTLGDVPVFIRCVVTDSAALVRCRQLNGAIDDKFVPIIELQ